MKQIVKLIAPALCVLAIGCGGTHSAGITFPYVRMFNAVDGQPTAAVQFHDLNVNLLATTPAQNLGTANPPPDATFVYTLATPTILDHNGAPLYAGASYQFAQNYKYTIIACGGTPTTLYSTLVLTDDQNVGAAGTVALRFINASDLVSPSIDIYVLPAGATTIPATATPSVKGIAFSTIPTTVNGATIDGNGYLIFPDGGAYNFSVIVTLSGSKTPLFPAEPISIADAAYYTDVIWDTGTTPAQSPTIMADLRAN